MRSDDCLSHTQHGLLLLLFHALSLLALCNNLVNRVLKLINLNHLFRAHVAQSVERFLGKEEVHQFDSGHGLQNNSRMN